jgi:hypothetical protein
MAKFEISCPHHGKIEILEVPDSYPDADFEGEVMCGNADERCPLKIKFVSGLLTKVERA